MNWYGQTSYAAAAAVYAATAVLLLLGRPKNRRALAVIAAAAVTALWATAAAVLSARAALPPPAFLALDAVHGLVWTAAILSFLEQAGDGGRHAVWRWFAAGAAVLAVALAVGLTQGGDAAGGRSLVFIAIVGIAVTGLLAVEQVFRNASEEQRRPFRLLCLAIGGIFTADLFVYSHATLLDGVALRLWESRGFANALCAPLILLALRRDPAWARGVFVSRYITFYTASLLGVGLYLIGMALIAYVIRAVGGEWSVLLELLFLGAALVVLVVVLFSTSIRARLRVSLVKNFYRSRYDYRAEWLRLTDRLANARDTRSLARDALEGVAAIVGSPAADLWITRDGKQYDWLMSLTGEGVKPPYASDHPLVAFLARTSWVVDSREYAEFPDRYDSAFGAPAGGVLPKESLIVPLDARGHLQGFIVLQRPPAIGRLNFDDHDILKTAGKQVAVFLSQALAQEQLVETRQFEAVNKLTTFLVHDLKNVLAQQELVVANAQRFGHRPEFIKDAIATISGGVERMKKVLAQLRGGVLEAKVILRANLSKALLEVVSQCADREPVPRLGRVDEQLAIEMDRGELVNALVHLVRNAQDATPPDGRITIDTESVNGDIHVLVEDTGAGMDEAFVRDRLFTPFDSTKGSEGMGIGAYQARELVRSLGGRLEVTSEPGRGTAFRLVFPYQRIQRRTAAAEP